MAFFDQTLLLSSAQAITATAASTNIYDVTGYGSGVAPVMTFGNAAKAQFDIGASDSDARPTLFLVVTTAFTTGNAATLQVQIQAAVDSSNSPGSYTTIVETDAFAAAVLVAGATLIIPIPKVTLGESLPRFYRVNYVVGTGVFGAGALTAVILLNPPNGQTGTLYSSNFKSVTV